MISPEALFVIHAVMLAGLLVAALRHDAFKLAATRARATEPGPMI